MGFFAHQHYGNGIVVEGEKIVVQDGKQREIFNVFVNRKEWSNKIPSKTKACLNDHSCSQKKITLGVKAVPLQ